MKPQIKNSFKINSVKGFDSKYLIILYVCVFFFSKTSKVERSFSTKYKNHSIKITILSSLFSFVFFGWSIEITVRTIWLTRNCSNFVSYQTENKTQRTDLYPLYWVINFWIIFALVYLPTRLKSAATRKEYNVLEIEAEHATLYHCRSHLSYSRRACDKLLVVLQLFY